MMKRQKRRIILLLCILGLTLIIAAILFYKWGYIPNNSLKSSQEGGLYIAAPFPDSEIFINNKKEKTTNIFQLGIFLPNLKPGLYSVMVAKKGFWPWAKKLKVETNYLTEARAFMVPQNPKGKILLKGKFLNFWPASQNNKILALEEKRKENLFKLVFYLPEENNFFSDDSFKTKQLLTFEKLNRIYQKNDSFIFETEKGLIQTNFDLANKKVKAYLLKEKPKSAHIFSLLEDITPKKDIKIWLGPTKKEILASWLKRIEIIPYFLCSQKPCQKTIQIFKGQFPIKELRFFPGRSDVLIMAVENGVYALELDGRNGRLLQPIYKGKNPNFLILKKEIDTLYILDSGSLIKISLK